MSDYECETDDILLCNYSSFLIDFKLSWQLLPNLCWVFVGYWYIFNPGQYCKVGFFIENINFLFRKMCSMCRGSVLYVWKRSWKEFTLLNMLYRLTDVFFWFKGQCNKAIEIVGDYHQSWSISRYMYSLSIQYELFRIPSYQYRYQLF